MRVSTKTAASAASGIVKRMSAIISVSNLSKTYASGFEALKRVNLDIRRGEIFALLGPNGAGKTTLIGIICGIVNATSGRVTIDGHDNVADYRAARSLVGLVRASEGEALLFGHDPRRAEGRMRTGGRQSKRGSSHRTLHRTAAHRRLISR